MKNIKDTTKSQATATETNVKTDPKVATKSAKKGVVSAAAKQSERLTPKQSKVEKSEADGERADRLPTTLDELKESKGGFVAQLFILGKDRDSIAKELKAAFKLSEAQALKITRRITGRVRLYQRIFELVPVKK